MMMIQLLKSKVSLFAMLLLLVVSCNTDDEMEPGEVVASFQFAISDDNFLEVSFTNFSQNATSYAWNFGDGNNSSEESPTHVYAATGDYTVSLIATGADGTTANRSENISIADPDEELTLLAGTTSKEWKIYREGIGLEVGPNEDQASGWFGMENNGLRPCLYDDVVTFHRDGTFEYNDNNTFWGEFGVWGTSSAENPLFETCFEPTAANMTIDGNDVSAWGSGSHQFALNSADGTVTLTGAGAWLVVPNLGTDAPHGVDAIPATKTVPVSITEEDGYDLMVVTFDHGDAGAGGAGFRRATYVSYDDWNNEPDLLLEPPSCELDAIAPMMMSHTFESATSFVELGVLAGVSTITVGVDDPADAGATKVGQFDRVNAEFQEAMLKVSPEDRDLDFSNLTTLSMDVYLPSTNDHTGSLSRRVEIGLADQSCVPQWWTDLYQYGADDVALDTWVTLSYNLDSPTFAASGDTPLTRAISLDMVYINIGGGGHFETGTFYIRNLVFQ